MKRIVYTISDENGIHARPAGKIVNTARLFQSEIRLILPVKDTSADAKKLFAVMGLGIRKGDTIHIEAEGADAEEAAAAMQNTLTEAGL
ncbi:MAG: HPr family phosphocarrier protein [Ruminococcaceae bacterium]|nr:HPr family phosphocarrier protein [Oscillospiraceae bacterium]